MGKGDDAHNPFDAPAKPMKIDDPFDPRHRQQKKAPSDPFSPSPVDVEGDLDDALREGDEGRGTRDA